MSNGAGNPSKGNRRRTQKTTATRITSLIRKVIMSETPMKVEIICSDCEEDNDGTMNPIGPLTISPQLIQSQEYQCLSCLVLIRVTIYPPNA